MIVEIVVLMKNDTVICVSPGDGSNLHQEDIDNGYVDYLYYDTYLNLFTYRDGEEYDGGLILLEREARTLTVPDVVGRLCEMLNCEKENVVYTIAIVKHEKEYQNENYAT